MRDGECKAYVCTYSLLTSTTPDLGKEARTLGPTLDPTAASSTIPTLPALSHLTMETTCADLSPLLCKALVLAGLGRWRYDGAPETEKKREIWEDLSTGTLPLIRLWEDTKSIHGHAAVYLITNELLKGPINFKTWCWKGTFMRCPCRSVWVAMIF